MLIATLAYSATANSDPTGPDTGSSAAADSDATDGKTVDEEDLSKKLANPIARLMSVPIQYNRDTSTAATTEYVSIKPVIPFSIGPDWNLITRTIVPFISYKPSHGSESSSGGDVAEDVDPTGGGTASGIGDTQMSFYFSPRAPTSTGWIWGVGPVFLWPTASERILGAGKWGAGPTAVVLKQTGGFTYGLLTNQIRSYGGWGTKAVSSTFLQPFFSYGTKTKTTFGVNTESTYDWEQHQWDVPLYVYVKQMAKVGTRVINLEIGYRYYVERPLGGPDWGLRAGVTLLFPK